jgi:hypothetical protein
LQEKKFQKIPKHFVVKVQKFAIHKNKITGMVSGQETVFCWVPVPLVNYCG